MSRQKNRWKRLKSMRVVLFLLMVIMALVLLFGMTVFTLQTYRDQKVSEKVSEVTEYAETMSNQIAASGYLAGQNTTEINAEMVTAADIFDGRIVVVDAGLKIIADTYGYEVGKTMVTKPVIECIRGVSSCTQAWEKSYIELTIPVRQGAKNEIAGAIQVRASLEKALLGYQGIYDKLMLINILLLCGVIVIAFIISRNMVKPFKTVISSIRRIADGYLEENMSIHGFYEVEQISDTFNEMLQQMKKLEDSRQEFVSNVSHELKTPMTSMKVLADALMAQEDVPVELYKEFLVDITEEIERENKIITDLLSLVKMNQKDGEMHIAQVDINELLEIILKRIKPIAQKRSIELVFESFRPVVAEVDEVKLSLAISNLIENAVKYNIDEGYVRVS
ncbi:MAG: two-component sensor histidine kinase, partial [Lachnospiraceae bacterium]|nr:two-component sensor histidine kinase [Lachnospiraceae bacterium]